MNNVTECIYCGKQFIPDRSIVQEYYPDQCEECGSLLHLQGLLWHRLEYNLFQDPKNIDFLNKRVLLIKEIKQRIEDFLREENRSIK